MVCLVYGSFAYYGRLSHVLTFCVSQSDTISGVLFALSPTVQKLSYRRISQCVSLRGHSIGGWASWSLPISSYLHSGNVMAHGSLISSLCACDKKTGVMVNPCPYSLTSGRDRFGFLRGYPPSAVPGFEPGTFGSEARCFAHVATEAAWILPAKLSLNLFTYYYSGFA